MLLWNEREAGEAERNAIDVGFGRRAMDEISTDWEQIRAQEAARLLRVRRWYAWAHGLAMLLIYGGSTLLTVACAAWLIQLIHRIVR